jgi:hypothetical protein
MHEQHHSDRKNVWWGCMATALVVLGAFAVSVNIAFGGTDHLPEIRSWFCFTIGVGILILMVVQKRGEARLQLPSLHPVIGLAVVAAAFYLTLF